MRESLEQAGGILLGRIDEDTVIVSFSDNCGVWHKSPGYTGYVLLIDGLEYEFQRSALPGDLWWANLPIKNRNAFLQTIKES